MGNNAYPICWGGSIAGSYQSGSGVDYIVGDFNPGYVPIDASGDVFGIRAARYSGTGTAQVEWDAGIDVAGKDVRQLRRQIAPTTGKRCSTCGTATRSRDSPTPSSSCARVREPTSASPCSRPPTRTSSTSEPRSARQFETINHYTVFTPTVNAWHALVFTNENNVSGTYTVNITTGTPTTSVADGTAPRTGLHGVMPNPMRGETRIQFSIARPGAVSMQVLDMAGRRVGAIPTRHWNAGSWTVPGTGVGCRDARSRRGFTSWR